MQLRSQINVSDLGITSCLARPTPLWLLLHVSPGRHQTFWGWTSWWCQVHHVLSGPWHAAWYVGNGRCTQKSSLRLQRQLFCRNIMKTPTLTWRISPATVFREIVSFSSRQSIYFFNFYFFVHLKTVLLENSLITGTSNFILPLQWRTRWALCVVNFMPSVSLLMPFLLEQPASRIQGSPRGLLCLWSGSGCDGLLCLTTASRTRHKGPLTKFLIHFKKCKLKSAESWNIFFRNTVQTFPASAFNGSFFAKYCLLSQLWFWENTFVLNSKRQSKTISTVHSITLSPGRWTRRASFFPHRVYTWQHLVLSSYLPGW